VSVELRLSGYGAASRRVSTDPVSVDQRLIGYTVSGQQLSLTSVASNRASTDAGSVEGSRYSHPVAFIRADAGSVEGSRYSHAVASNRASTDAGSVEGSHYSHAVAFIRASTDAGWVQGSRYSPERLKLSSRLRLFPLIKDRVERLHEKIVPPHH
jgi:hypothetical protein